MFGYILIAYVTACVIAQDTNFDLNWVERYGPKPTAVVQRSLLDSAVPSTIAPKTIVHKERSTCECNGKNCQCVPYYVCNTNKVDPKDPTIITWRKIERRTGAGFPPQPCQDSVEVCCEIPEIAAEVVKPKSDPAKVGGCGYRNPNGLGAFMNNNNREAQFGEYPWVVALINNINKSYIGMGVIIHPQVIMTAGHYGARYGPSELMIRAGEWDMSTDKEIYDFQERLVQNIHYHSEFSPKNLKNDIALLRLQEPLQLAEHINTLCLPDLNENFDNSRDCVSNGWGKDIFGVKGRYAFILKEMTQDMVPRDLCQSQLQHTRLGARFRLHSSFVCAKGLFDTCQGDGGAALACPIGNERYKLTGLVSWGIGCGQKDVPSVYTNVPAFRTWVDDKMQDWGFGTSSYTI